MATGETATPGRVTVAGIGSHAAEGPTVVGRARREGLTEGHTCPAVSPGAKGSAPTSCAAPSHRQAWVDCSGFMFIDRTLAGAHVRCLGRTSAQDTIIPSRNESLEVEPAPPEETQGAVATLRGETLFVHTRRLHRMGLGRAGDVGSGLWQGERAARLASPYAVDSGVRPVCVNVGERAALCVQARSSRVFVSESL